MRLSMSTSILCIKLPVQYEVIAPHTSKHAASRIFGEGYMRRMAPLHVNIYCSCLLLIAMRFEDRHTTQPDTFEQKQCSTSFVRFDDNCPEVCEVTNFIGRFRSIRQRIWLHTIAELIQQ